MVEVKKAKQYRHDEQNNQNMSKSPPRNKACTGVATIKISRWVAQVDSPTPGFSHLSMALHILPGAPPACKKKRQVTINRDNTKADKLGRSGGGSAQSAPPLLHLDRLQDQDVRLHRQPHAGPSFLRKCNIIVYSYKNKDQ